jgi:hypothetical protein
MPWSPARSALLCTALAVATSPARAAAQRGVDITPVVGLYLPLAKLIDEYDQGSGIRLQTTQLAGFPLGGRVAVWWSARFAVEGSLTYTASEVRVDVSGFGSGTPDGSVTTLSARALYRLTGPRARGLRWHVLGGLAVIDRGGEWVDNINNAGIAVEGLTDVGAVLGGGMTLAIRGPWSLRVDLEDHVYFAEFTFDDGISPPATTERKLQQDIVVSVGVAFRLGGR